MYRSFIICILLFPVVCFSQSDHQDSSWVQGAVASAVSQYHEVFPNTVLLYSGLYYIDYDQGVDGFPYFFDEYFTDGSVVVDGRRFEASIKYDCHKDKLVIDNVFGDLELISQRVEQFEIYGHLFRNIRDVSVYDGKLDAGFYDILYEGDIKLYSKRLKSFVEYTSDRVLKREFLTKDRFYLIKDDLVKTVKNKRGVMMVFKDKRSVLKKKLKEAKVNFNHSFEKAVIMTTQLYDELKEVQ